MHATILAATATVLAGVAAFAVGDMLRPETRIVTFDAPSPDAGPLEAINGAAFPHAKGVATITEPLAHVRLPLGRTLLGKHLVVHPRFHVDEGDVLEVGVKKTSFWLDYDRLPLEHRLLDHLLVRDEATWSALRSGSRIVYLNPRFPNPWKRLEDFERDLPTDGTIGLYGHAQLACPTCTTASFRVTDDPDRFRALYAFYPEPNRSDPEWTENEQRFDLARAYQNDDGSIDIMLFMQRKDGGPIRLLIDSIEFRIEPGWPRLQDLALLARRNLRAVLQRPAAPGEM